MGSVISSCAPYATSEKFSENSIKRLFPIVNNVFTLTEFLSHIIENDYMRSIRQKLIKRGLIDDETSLLHTEGCHADQALMGNQSEVCEFILCRNPEEVDAKWNDSKFKYGAMAPADSHGPGHVFITTKTVNWKHFNILSVMLQPDGLLLLMRLKYAAGEYARRRGWRNTGTFFHCYPHEKSNTLKMHIVNLDNTGIHFKAAKNINLSIDDAISVATVINAMDRSVRKKRLHSNNSFDGRASMVTW